MEAKCLRDTRSRDTGTLGGRPLRKQAVRVLAQGTSTAKIQVSKTPKSGLGRSREQILRCHFGGSLDSAEDLAQQERQFQQDRDDAGGYAEGRRRPAIRGPPSSLPHTQQVYNRPAAHHRLTEEHVAAEGHPNEGSCTCTH